MRAAWGLLFVAGLAQAEVGKVSALEGTATRTAAGATEAQPLAVDAPLEVGDVLQVGDAGSLKLTLADESELMLGPGARLELTEANFSSLDNRKFSARLGIGELWAHVKKALVGSDAKFEITTERAVAGVRGTIFEVAVAKGADELETNVGVEEGEVEVVQPDEDAPSNAPPEKKFKRMRIKRGEALLLKRHLAKKLKHQRRANAFHRFVERQRLKRLEKRIELRQQNKLRP